MESFNAKINKNKIAIDKVPAAVIAAFKANTIIKSAWEMENKNE